MTRLAGADTPASAPQSLQRDRYQSVSLHNRTRVSQEIGNGKIFRTGDGWFWPEPSGCRTKSSGGELRMRVVGLDRGPLRLDLRLRGLAAVECPVSITMNGRLVCTARLRAGKLRWLTCDLPVGAGPGLSIMIHGAQSEAVRVSAGGVEKTRTASITVVGFLLCDRDDAVANAAFARFRYSNFFTGAAG